MKKFCSLLIAFAGLLLFAGCASNPYSAAHKAGMHTVQLQAEVESDHDMRYGVDASKPDDLRSTVSTEMMDDVGQDGLRRMHGVMKKANLIVPQMIHDELEKRLHDQSRLILTDQPPADGIFVVKILQYGFNDMPFSLMHETPFVVLQLELRNSQGHVLWKRKSRWSRPSSDEAGQSWDEYEMHPEELRDDWTAQINEALNKVLPN